MLNLVIFTVSIILNNVNAMGNLNCYNKVFVNNTAEDNILLDSGLLMEVVVSHRAECVSLSHLHEGCNLILYNPPSNLCRLHHFDHVNQTGSGTMVPGWSNYARLCTGEPTSSGCNATDTSMLDLCHSCFLDNAWQHNDLCITYQTVASSNGGNSVFPDFDFDLVSGMDIVVKGPVYDSNGGLGVCLEDTDDVNSHLGIDLDFFENWCDAYDEINDDICDDQMPTLDFSGLTLTFRLTTSKVQIYIDGKFIIQYENLLRRNKMDIYGFGDGAELLIVKRDESCYEP